VGGQIELDKDVKYATIDNMRMRSVGLIPPFNADGLLPPGDYPIAMRDLRWSSLVVGPSAPHAREGWDAPWRAQLVGNLEELVRQLEHVGVTEIFIDGSFAEDKSHPNDIDGYFVCDVERLQSGQLQSDLNALDPYKVWTWDPASRRRFRGYAKKQLPMWHRYRVELYPHARGLLSGLTDERGNELEFPAAFRRSRRDGRARGIVRITGSAS
jgi:hypothetical protein